MLATLTACNNPLETPVRFSVNVAQDSNVVTESDGTIVAPKGTKITFNFAGEPDFISFTYDAFFATTAQLSFSTQLGNWGNGPYDNMSLFISNSFAGLSRSALADSILIRNHEWVDISSLCEFPEVRGDEATSSILFDEYRGDTITLAFRYKTNSNSDFQPMWTIKKMQIDNRIIKTGLSAINITANTMGFTPFDMMKVSNGNAYETSTTAGGVWDTSNADALQIRQTFTGRDLNEDWLITRQLVIPKGKPEKGETVSIKNTTDRVTSYSHTFADEGEYTVVFKASNHNYKANSSTQQAVKIVIKD